MTDSSTNQRRDAFVYRSYKNDILFNQLKDRCICSIETKRREALIRVPCLRRFVLLIYRIYSGGKRYFLSKISSNLFHYLMKFTDILWLSALLNPYFRFKNFDDARQKLRNLSNCLLDNFELYQCCGAEIIYFRLRLLFGSTFFLNFGSGSSSGSTSGSSPSPVLLLKKGIFCVSTILKLYYKSNIMSDG